MVTTHAPSDSPGDGGTYQTIAALRAVAALMVVAFHAWFAVQERMGGGGPDILAHGTAGVDVFFVISGFVMVVSSQRLMRRPNGWRVFLWRRLLRIVPLYWLMTAVMLGLAAALPQMLHHAAPDFWHVVASFLFIPSHDAAGELRPVIADGWTLSFEMLFYVVFAAALLLRICLFRIAVPLFAVLAVVALVRADDWPGWTFLASELPIEFLFGAMVGTFAVQGRFLARPLAVVGLFVPLAAFALLTPGPEFGRTVGFGAVSLRVLTYGVPGMIAVASLVALERPARRVMPRWLLALGDGSYSIYLGHAFIMAALSALAVRLGGGHPGAFIVVGLVASAVGGMALYVAVERPMQAGLKRLLKRRTGVLEKAAETV